MSLTGCSVLPELAAPTANFLIGLYDADTYITKDCAWYERIEFSQETKDWFGENNPPRIVVLDLSKVARNNDLYGEICEK